MLLPSAFTASRLFAAGATIGPLIDGLHNQALLRYETLPIAVQFTETLSLKTSAVVPPLLGVSYIVLGRVLPNALEALLKKIVPFQQQQDKENGGGGATGTKKSSSSVLLGEDEEDNEYNIDENKYFWLTLRAAAAVVSTAAIVRWTEVLLTTAGSGTTDNGSYNGIDDAFLYPSAFSAAGTVESYLLLLTTVCIVQWAWLDGTMTTLLVASLAAVIGPLAELPFLSLGWWEYYQSPALYYPLGGDATTSALGIHSLTGPCYFAVTMDAIALGRWFAAMETLQQRGQHQPADTSETGEIGNASVIETGLPVVNGAVGDPTVTGLATNPVGDEPDSAAANTEHTSSEKR